MQETICKELYILFSDSKILLRAEIIMYLNESQKGHLDSAFNTNGQGNTVTVFFLKDAWDNLEIKL